MTRAVRRPRARRAPRRAAALIRAAAGMLLIPPTLAAAWAAAQIFSEMSARADEAPGPLWLGLGAGLWLVCWVALPRPVRLYVLGHELTHVLWTWMFGGRASRLRVTARGGEVRVTRTNAWVALAPYFFPIYALAVVLLYGALELALDLSPYRPVAIGLVGFAWAFHITFTVSMLAERQPDVRAYGRLFSLSLIVLLNVAGVALALAVVAGVGARWWLVRWADALVRIADSMVGAARRLLGF